jgi:hypothetical protein
LTASQTEVSVFFWSGGTAEPVQYSFGSPSSDGLLFGIQAGLAVGPTGVVWVGANNTLARLDPGTGSLAFLVVPEPPDNAAAEAHRPPQVRGLHSIEALATDGSGDVAIAMSGSSAVVIYHDSSNTFSTVALAAGAEPVDVAYGANGTLAVATINWTQGGTGTTNLLELVQPDGSISTVTTGSGTVAPYSSNGQTGFLSTGSGTSVDLTMAASGGAGSQASATATSFSAHVDFTQRVVEIPNGDLLGSSGDGFSMIDTTTGASTEYKLPSFTCTNAPSIPPESSPTSRPANISNQCPEMPQRYVSDSQGNVWFTSSFSANAVSEIVASAWS